MKTLRDALFVLFFSFLAVGSCLGDASASGINLDVQEFRLANGMLFLVVERHTTPQVACRLAIRAGSALEEAGKTGIAHMLEHMMFKGTKNFGTRDPQRDAELQRMIDAAYGVIRAEQRKRSPDRALIEQKLAEMNRLREEVRKIYVPKALSSQLGKNGAVGVNAFTTKDQTQYKASVPSDMLEQWFSIISEQLFEPAWREFYVEKEVVQREWAYRYINNPAGAAWLDLNTAAYAAHPYHNPVIGWKSDMEKWSTEDAVAFHGKYYSPTNAVCALVGDVTVETAKRLAHTYFGRYPAGSHAPERVTEEPEQQGPRRSVRFLKGARTPLVRIGFHAASMGTADFYALDALTMILSQGLGARMTQNIVNKGLAVHAWAYNPDNRYGGMVILGGSPNEPTGIEDKGLAEEARRRLYIKACRELEDLLLAQAEALKTETVTVRELARIKKLNQRDFLDRMRSNEQLAGTLATLEVQYGWRYLKTYLENMEAVTPQDIMRVARKYIRKENMTSVYVIPGGKPERPPEKYMEVRSVGGSAAARSYRPATFENHSTYPTPEGWKHPLSFERKPEKIRYPAAAISQVGGATLFYLPDRELPLIDLTILVKAGEVDVPDSKIGLSALLSASLVRGGTERFSPAEFAMVLDENAIRVSISVGEEASTVHLSVMREDWEKGLELLQEILTRPRFDATVLEAVKGQQVAALMRQGGDAEAVSNREAALWHFRGHPYGRDPLLGLKTIRAITRGDLVRFLRAYFVPANMVAAVSGDIDKAEAVKGLESLLSALPKGEASARRLEDPSETPPVLALIHKPGQVQSQVAIRLRTVKRTNPDYWKIALLANVFGGEDSMLYTRLRDDLGLVYSAGFFETYRWRAGFLAGYIGCKGDKTGEAIRETVKIMREIRDALPEDALEQKRLDLLNSFVFNVDTPAMLVNVYAKYYMRGEPLDTLERIQDTFLTASREELESLAGVYLDPAKLQIFVVADRDIVVKKHGEGEITLGETLKALSAELGLPYREIPLR